MAQEMLTPRAGPCPDSGYRELEDTTTLAAGKVELWEGVLRNLLKNKTLREDGNSHLHILQLVKDNDIEL